MAEGILEGQALFAPGLSLSHLLVRALLWTS